MNDDTVVPLGVDPQTEEVPPPRASSKLHSGAVLATSSFAIVTLLAWLSFVTVGWSGSPRRVVIAVVLFSVVGLLASIAITVFTAARDTYARPTRK